MIRMVYSQNSDLPNISAGSVAPGRASTNFTKDFLGWNNSLNSIAEVKGSHKYIQRIFADLAFS